MTPLPASLDRALADTTLLVVDDKPLFRDMVRSAFLTRAHGVREATSIEKAAEILNRSGVGIGCVICDWDIAPFGGLELLRMIRAGTLTGIPAQTPVVILTARPDADAVKVAMDLDVNGFVVTPVSLDKLIGTVSEAMTRPWTLQKPNHYASVRGIAPPPQPLEKVTLEKVALEKVPSFNLTPRRTDRNGRPLFQGRAYGRRSETTKNDLARSSLKNVRMCILDDVSPGVVLAKDLRDRQGHILAASGTELKPAVLERLKNVGYALSDSYCVWVGER
jgi:DNA-binding NarL/FixJ family response regulator